jgi:hypothetical protein
LQPHRIKTFKLSRDKHFVEKLTEVSELLCLGPVYFSSFGSDFAKAR